MAYAALLRIQLGHCIRIGAAMGISMFLIFFVDQFVKRFYTNFEIWEKNKINELDGIVRGNVLIW